MPSELASAINSFGSLKSLKKILCLRMAVWMWLGMACDQDGSQNFKLKMASILCATVKQFIRCDVWEHLILTSEIRDLLI